SDSGRLGIDPYEPPAPYMPSDAVAGHGRPLRPPLRRDFSLLVVATNFIYHIIRSAYTMDLITVRDLFRHTADYAGKEISVGGWVRSIRASKALVFIVLSDGTYFNPLQVVYHDTMENFQAVSKLNVGTALIVKGTLVETPDAKQPFELQATEVT